MFNTLVYSESVPKYHKQHESNPLKQTYNFRLKKKPISIKNIHSLLLGICIMTLLNWILARIVTKPAEVEHESSNISATVDEITFKVASSNVASSLISNISSSDEESSYQIHKSITRRHVIIYSMILLFWDNLITNKNVRF